jgi:uncharacterized FlaG/YvyC family protein
MAGRQGFLFYVKKAFTQYWNLLAVGAGSAFGIISGHPDVILPLVMAGEILYLAGLSTHPKFQAAMDAQELKATQKTQTQSAAIKTQQILASLSKPERVRFEKLKSQCIELIRISSQVKDDADGKNGTIAELQTSGMNRLLWIFLKLLYYKNAIERFLDTIEVEDIHNDIERSKERIATLGPPESDSPTAAKRRALLQDHLQTSEMRIKNYERSKENLELIEDELERLSTKITSLAEMGINRQDPNFITSEVDTVSSSVKNSEKAMSELQFVATLSGPDDVAPELLNPTPQKLEIGEQ